MFESKWNTWTDTSHKLAELKCLQLWKLANETFMDLFLRSIRFLSAGQHWVHRACWAITEAILRWRVQPLRYISRHIHFDVSQIARHHVRTSFSSCVKPLSMTRDERQSWYPYGQTSGLDFKKIRTVVITDAIQASKGQSVTTVTRLTTDLFRDNPRTTCQTQHWRMCWHPLEVSNG